MTSRFISGITKKIKTCIYNFNNINKKMKNLKTSKTSKKTKTTEYTEYRKRNNVWEATLVSGQF